MFHTCKGTKGKERVQTSRSLSSLTGKGFDYTGSQFRFNVFSLIKRGTLEGWRSSEHFLHDRVWLCLTKGCWTSPANVEVPPPSNVGEAVLDMHTYTNLLDVITHTACHHFITTLTKLNISTATRAHCSALFFTCSLELRVWTCS